MGRRHLREIDGHQSGAPAALDQRVEFILWRRIREHLAPPRRYIAPCSSQQLEQLRAPRHPERDERVRVPFPVRTVQDTRDETLHVFDVETHTPGGPERADRVTYIDNEKHETVAFVRSVLGVFQELLAGHQHRGVIGADPRLRLPQTAALGSEGIPHLSGKDFEPEIARQEVGAWLGGCRRQPRGTAIGTPRWRSGCLSGRLRSISRKPSSWWGPSSLGNAVDVPMLGRRTKRSTGSRVAPEHFCSVSNRKPFGRTPSPP